MKIGICDDEPLMTTMLKRIIEEILRKPDIKVEISTFLSGGELIERIDDLDAVFLDIEMPELDGFEAGNVIMKRNPNCKIIIATGILERFKESFKINAFRFITKPYDSIEIEEALQALIKTKIGEETIPLFINRIQFEIRQKDIKYFKAFNGYSEAIVEDKCFRKELSLNELEEILDDRLFIRIHKKYLVNIRFVESYKNSMVKIDAKYLTVSRRKHKEVEKMYINYAVSNGGL
jgi:DNA-binding LytR/AlgR family response regulator